MAKVKCDVAECDAEATDSCCGVRMCELDYAKHRKNIQKHFPLRPPVPPTLTSANDRQVGGTHYQVAIQPWDFITANDIPFLEGNAIVYIARHRRKNGREDLEKAIHYLQKAIEVYYPETPCKT